MIDSLGRVCHWLTGSLPSARKLQSVGVCSRFDCFQWTEAHCSLIYGDHVDVLMQACAVKALLMCMKA